MCSMTGKGTCKEFEKESKRTEPVSSNSLHQLDDKGKPQSELEGEEGSEVEAIEGEAR